MNNSKDSVYHCKYQPKSKVFTPGDKVRLTKIPRSRGWVSKHAKPGMTGIVVDYGPGIYEYTVYWSRVDYRGEPVDVLPNRWQIFFVKEDEIERIK